ncbi:MAG: DUF433 domain-containing protein [Tangfeifania sp.]
MENKLLNRITLNPEICHGRPPIQNTRYRVDLILDLLSAGMTTENRLLYTKNSFPLLIQI